jgi:acetylglutamate kinase
MVLSGSVNADIVGLICAQGGRAMGLSGRDDNMLLASRVGPRQSKNDKGESFTVDLGRVGKINRVKPELIDNLMANGFVPVIAPIAVDADGKTLNINADNAAGEIAAAMQAAKLVLMTDVDGVRGDDGKMLPSLSAEQADHLIDQGVIRGGMIPKVQCALDAVRNGVEKVHIIDGRTKHALLLEIFTDLGVGTEIHRDGGS